MSEKIEKVEEVIENTEPKTEEVVSTWKVVDDAPEVHPAFMEQPKQEVVVEKVEEQPKTEEKIVEEKVELPIIDEQVILKELNEKYGFEAKSLDDLKPKEVAKLDPETEKYLEYKKETGRGYADFLETQKDFTAEPKENVLLQYLKLENPTLNEKQIERLYKKEYEIPEFADEDEITDKEIVIERDYQKGLKLLESQKEKYMVRKGLDESIPDEVRQKVEAFDNLTKQQQENQIAYEQTAKDFQAKTDEVFSNNFEGFKVKVGEDEFSVKPENIEETKKTLSDLSNFDKKFFDETGKLKDPQGYYKALHFAMNPDKVAEHFIKIGMAKQLELDEKESKNIVVRGSGNIQTGGQSKTWKVIEE
jgi:hypothetical protein